MRPLFVICACLSLTRMAPAQTFRLTVPTGAHPSPITGRAFLFVARSDRTEPRLQSGASRTSEPFFGVDVLGLRPGAAVTVDPTTPGFPLTSLRLLPAGDYFVQGLLLPYTRFERADGHTIWAHQDAGEGQRFNTSPGSLVSAVRKVRIDPKGRGTVTLRLDQTLPPVAAQSVQVTQELADFAHEQSHRPGRQLAMR